MKANDLSINRARKYLIEVAKINFPDTRQWQNFQAYHKLRNLIVHNNGVIKPEDTSIAFIEALKHPGLHFQVYIGVKERVIKLNDAFCKQAIENIMSFFEEFEKSLLQRLKFW